MTTMTIHTPLSTRLRHFNPMWYFERAALLYARNKVRDGSWGDLRLNCDTRFNILLGADALNGLAMDIALTSDSDSENAKRQITALRTFAFMLGNWAATTKIYVPVLETMDEIGSILKFYESRPATIKAVDILEKGTFGFDVQDWAERHTATEEVR